MRRFALGDIAQVAGLWWKFLRKGSGPPPSQLQAYLRELYFSSPLLDDDLPSLVYEAKDGKVVGFLGVVLRKFCLRGRPIRVAFGGNYVMDPTARTSLGGLQLLAQYMKGNQDLSITDSATDVSRNLLERLGFRTILPFSIYWARPLRPSRYAAYAATSAIGSRFRGSVQFMTAPFCALADAVASRLPSGSFRPTEPPLRSADLDMDTLLKCISEFRGTAPLNPAPDDLTQKWLLNFMERMHPRATLRKRLLRDGKDKIVGWYLYYLKPGAPCQVIQIGADRGSQKAVIKHLLYDAWNHGAIGLHGAAPPGLMPDLAEENCFFTCRGGWVVAHSRDPEIVDILSSGDVNLSRLDGEWCLNFDD